MNGTESGNMNSFEQFIDHYGPSISSAIARLAGLSDKKELETLTVDVLIDLWEKRMELFNEKRPTAFIYKILLQHVFAYLKKQGNEAQIALLQHTLLIDPVHYAHILEPEKKSFKSILLHKISRIWKRS